MTEDEFLALKRNDKIFDDQGGLYVVVTEPAEPVDEAGDPTGEHSIIYEPFLKTLDDFKPEEQREMLCILDCEWWEKLEPGQQRFALPHTVQMALLQNDFNNVLQRCFNLEKRNKEIVSDVETKIALAVDKNLGKISQLIGCDAEKMAKQIENNSNLQDDITFLKQDMERLKEKNPDDPYRSGYDWKIEQHRHSLNNLLEDETFDLQVDGEGAIISVNYSMGQLVIHHWAREYSKNSYKTFRIISGNNCNEREFPQFEKYFSSFVMNDGQEVKHVFISD